MPAPGRKLLLSCVTWALAENAASTLTTSNSVAKSRVRLSRRAPLEPHPPAQTLPKLKPKLLETKWLREVWWVLGSGSPPSRGSGWAGGPQGYAGGF